MNGYPYSIKIASQNKKTACDQRLFKAKKFSEFSLIIFIFSLDILPAV
nr:MAG TPA: hypothetical protein [Caudoviricetes sp.]